MPSPWEGSDPEIPEAKSLAFPSGLDIPTSRSLYITFTQSLRVLYCILTIDDYHLIDNSDIRSDGRIKPENNGSAEIPKQKNDMTYEKPDDATFRKKLSPL